MRRAFIVGMDSMIGKALQNKLLSNGWEVIGSTRRKENVNKNIVYLDLKKISECSLPQAIDVVYLCAGITKTSQCQEQTNNARIINVEAPLALAKYYSNNNIHVVYLSSSAVFNGKKPKYRVKDPCCPLNLYGAYKAEVEEKLFFLSNKISIVRLTKVLTPDYPLIIDWYNSLKRNVQIYPFYDLALSPISIDFAVDGLIKVVQKNKFGITHLSGIEDVTYLNIAEYILNIVGAKPELIQPKSVKELSVTASKTLYASLEMKESALLFDKLESFLTTMNNLYGRLS